MDYRDAYPRTRQFVPLIDMIQHQNQRFSKILQVQKLFIKMSFLVCQTVLSNANRLDSLYSPLKRKNRN